LEGFRHLLSAVLGQSFDFSNPYAWIGAMALYNPAAYRQLVTRFGIDIRVATLSFRSLALCMLGYPEAAIYRIWPGPMQNSANSMTLGAVLAKR
jgi:hypothetical protein